VCHTVFPDVKIHFLFTGKGEKSRISSISLGLPELPSGVKRTRAFTYNKRNYQNFDLTIGRYHVCKILLSNHNGRSEQN